MSPIPALLLVLVTLAAPACKPKPAADPAAAQTPGRARIIEEIPTLAQARQIDTTGSADAERVTWQIPARLIQVAIYYRDLLPKLGWAIMSDVHDSTKVDMYARKEGKTLWFHIEQKTPEIVEWTIIGALTDSSRVGMDSARIGTPVPPRP